jgi:hypothetical protein
MKFPKALERESLRWYYNLLRTTFSGIPSKLIAVKKKSDIDPGKMYFFRYEAKHRATLPYWDAFPLIFPLVGKNDGFIGLNMHYLPPPLRRTFFTELLRFRRPNSPGLAIDYSALKSGRFLSITIKRYLTVQLRSNLYEVEESVWDRVIYLPTQNFQKQTAEYVWSQI